MNLYTILLVTFLCIMECLSLSIPYVERKSWIHGLLRHKRSPLSGNCPGPDCLSHDEPMRDCISEKQEKTRLSLLTGVPEYIPKCRQDGSYESVQCHPSTRFCWCVTRTGRLIQGSAVPSRGNSRRQINCSKFKRTTTPTPRRRKKKRKRAKRLCSHLEKSTFNSNLMKAFRSEYGRYQSVMRRSNISSTDPSSSISDKDVLTWKFKQLDRNHDSFLRKNETRILKRLAKQEIKPRRCAKTFAKDCANGDGKITQAEWHECLKVTSVDKLKLPFDTFKSLVDSGTSRRIMMHPSQLLSSELWFVLLLLVVCLYSASDVTPKSPMGSFEHSIKASDSKAKEVAEVSNCITERHTALASQADNESNIIPECTKSGKYKKVQCAQGKKYCWCVDEDSGHQIPRTIVENSEPDCSKSLKPMKGCKGSKKTKFLEDFFHFLFTKKSDTNFKYDPRHQRNATEEENIAKWYFKQLDTNNNKVLERKEWDVLRNETSTEKKFKKCVKRLPRHCDVDRSKNIDMSEWLNCLDIQTSKNSNSPRSSTSVHRPRQGKNPFTTLLRQDR